MSHALRSSGAYVLPFRTGRAAPSLLLFGLLLLASLQSPGHAAMREMEVGEAAPEIRLPDMQGHEFALESLQGKCNAVVVLFWGVWCPYCRELMVQLNRNYEELREHGVEVVAVSMRESPHKVGLFVSQLKPGFPVLVDEWATLKGPYLIKDVPRLVVMDQDLVVMDTRITTSAATMKEMIQGALDHSGETPQ